MGRVSYGVIAFKMEHPDELTEPEIVLAVRRAAADGAAALEKHGAKPSTIGEAMAQGSSDKPRIGEMTIQDAVDFKYFVDGEREP